jgi:hypothetical protein
MIPPLYGERAADVKPNPSKRQRLGIPGTPLSEGTGTNEIEPSHPKSGSAFGRLSDRVSMVNIHTEKSHTTFFEIQNHCPTRIVGILASPGAFGRGNIHDILSVRMQTLWIEREKEEGVFLSLP